MHNYERCVDVSAKWLNIKHGLFFNVVFSDDLNSSPCFDGGGNNLFLWQEKSVKSSIAQLDRVDIFESSFPFSPIPATTRRVV